MNSKGCNSPSTGAGYYYRIHCPAILFEYDNTQCKTTENWH